LDGLIDESKYKYTYDRRCHQKHENSQADAAFFRSQEGLIGILQRYDDIERAQDFFPARMHVAGSGGTIRQIGYGADDSQQSVPLGRAEYSRPFCQRNLGKRRIRPVTDIAGFIFYIGSGINFRQPVGIFDFPVLIVDANRLDLFLAADIVDDLVDIIP